MSAGKAAVLAYPASTWAAGQAIDTLGYDEAVVQVTALAGGDTIAIRQTLDGVNSVALMGVNANDLSTTNSIAANGVYRFPVSGSITWAQTGVASAPVLTLQLLRN